MNSMFAGLVLTLLTVMNYFIGGRRVLYPPFVYSLVWCLVTYLYGLSLIDMDKIQSITWWVIVLGAICFSVGSWIAEWTPKRLLKLRLAELTHPTISTFGKQFLIVVSMLALPFLIREVMSLGAGGGLGLLANVRTATTNIATSGETFRAYPASTYLPVFSVWVAILLFIEKSDKYFKVAFAIALICCLLATGRTLFLLLILGLTYVQIFRQKEGSIRTAIKIAVVPILLFTCIFVGVIFINKDLRDFTSGLGGFFSYFILGYILGPMGALNYVLTHPERYVSEPNRTFEFFLKAFSLVSGIPIKSPPILDKFVFIPFPANVYTVYKPLFTDFGFLGMLVTICVFGFIQTLIYKKALEGGKIALFFSVSLMYATFMSIFDDAYTNFQQIFLLLLLLTLYYGILNRMSTGLKIWPQLRLGIQFPRPRIRSRKRSVS